MKEGVHEWLPLTEAFYYILVALYPAEAHGYAIMQDVERMSGGRVRIGAGTLYTALSALQKKGLIANAPDIDSADSRRKHYTITDSGRLVLQAEMERMEELLQSGRAAMEQSRGGE
ncbi:PadR family transcriptional regulator [Paenibacillus xylaniclasticus]|uniref:PadR family transcriptional regulator n=1 Tax=Paenibacillus xylaniclasticus TaxID=588083 RepID=UPI000FDAB566|nr:MULTISPECIES: PadR family transcriptional regulator [Paenibacillus]GFN32176.1 PadR family transcriptional regulator [Paenibacillus curdlanolyticus]